MFADPLRKSLRSEGRVRGARGKEKEEGEREERPEGENICPTVCDSDIVNLCWPA